jgi:hypothetical protein
MDRLGICHFEICRSFNFKYVLMQWHCQNITVLHKAALTVEGAKRPKKAIYTLAPSGGVIFNAINKSPRLRL